MWRFKQCFGERNAIEDLTEKDVLSAVEFDETGTYLATGDRAGRVVIFEVDSSKPTAFSPSVVASSENTPNGEQQDSDTFEYKCQCEFQSHEAEFDYLKSLEIEEKINKIKWCKPSNNALFMLSTNDKTIKLWKVYEKSISNVSSMNVEYDSTSKRSLEDRRALYKSIIPPSKPTRLSVPKLRESERCVTSHPRKVYSNAHAYHVNSISVNSDGETFLSADDLRINLWNLGISDQSYVLVDIKPANMDDLTEVITASEFHPTQCNLFMYSSSRGTVKLGDMRSSALCDEHAKLFEEPELPGANRSFLSEIISSLSDIKFSADGRYIVSRDYLSMKLWDINMDSVPVQTIQIHEHLRPQLQDLFKSDDIFDKFELSVSADGKYIATGSYNNTFHIFDREAKNSVYIEASKYQSCESVLSTSTWNDHPVRTIENVVKTVDYKQKALHMSLHPNRPCIAVACLNNLYLYGK